MEAYQARLDKLVRDLGGAWDDSSTRHKSREKAFESAKRCWDNAKRKQSERARALRDYRSGA